MILSLEMYSKNVPKRLDQVFASLVGGLLFLLAAAQYKVRRPAKTPKKKSYFKHESHDRQRRAPLWPVGCGHIVTTYGCVIGQPNLMTIKKDENIANKGRKPARVLLD